MSRKYKDSKDVPTTVLCARLDELWKAVTGGRDSIAREFYMRIPAEVDNDADIVICEASQRLTRLEAENAQQAKQLEEAADLFMLLTKDVLEKKVRIDELKAMDSANKAMAVSQNNAITELYAQLQLSAGVIERQALLIQEFIEGVAAHEAKRQQRVHVRLGGTYHKALASFDTPQQKESDSE